MDAVEFIFTLAVTVIISMIMSLFLALLIYVLLHAGDVPYGETLTYWQTYFLTAAVGIATSKGNTE